MVSKKQTGFTIVELLIVIVVIGILAAITIVAYNGIQAKAKLSSKLSDVKAMQQKLELYRVEYGNYPDTDDTGVRTVIDFGTGITGKIVTEGSDMACDSLDRGKYCLQSLVSTVWGWYRISYWNDVDRSWYQVYGSSNQPEYNINAPGEVITSQYLVCYLNAPDVRPPVCSEPQVY